ncbi:MAG: heavy metal-binding domain-containing protein [Actinomycetota bacterium]|jgi:uncharacterized protein YbjQ (UPF0145 family)|nr:heavy metal-binding domain-containing protein [Actinomycetota bacterium]
MILSTGDIKQDYEVVDVVFGVQVIRSHFFRSGGRETLKFLPEANNKLADAAEAKGCDAVIWIDYDFAREKDVQIITAYGTAVKFK